MEVKLGKHAHFIVSMTTIYCLNNKKQPQALLFKITSSLLKLVNKSTHGDET